MASDFTISKVRFFEYGKPAPANSRFKGILDEQSLIGYYHYTEEKDKNDRNKEIDNIHDGGYLGYVSKDKYTFTSEGSGWLKNENAKHFEDALASLFKKDGDLWWETIISFSSEEVSRSYGLESVNDYKMLIDRCMPKICKAMKLDYANILWWGNRHVDTLHPHIHLNWIEKNPKTRDRGKLTASELRRVKNIIVTELSHIREERKNIDQEFKINYFKKKDEVYHELINAIGNNSFGKEIKEIKDLYNVLPKNGRLSYNSYTIKPYRNMIDKITDKILKDGKIQAYFNEYVNMLEKLERYQNALLSASGERDIANIKNTELDKLYSRIGNMILKDYKKKNIKNAADKEAVIIDNTAVDYLKDIINHERKKDLQDGYKYIFTVNRCLLGKENDSLLFTRIPGTKGKFYMYLEKKFYTQIDYQTGKYIIDSKDIISIFDKAGNKIDDMNAASLMKYWEDKSKVYISSKSQNKEIKSQNKSINKKSSSYMSNQVYRNKKTVRDYKYKIRRWMKFRNIRVSDSTIYKDMLEWERANNIKR